MPAGGRVSGTVNLEALSQLDEKELVLVVSFSPVLRTCRPA